MKVVIVDDTPTNLAFMAGLVRKARDCEAVTFSEAPAALEWCLRNDPDLVILDYMMPELTGLEFLRRMRRRPSTAQTPTLIVTADHERHVRYEALEAGATDFLTKPLDRVEFLSRVSNMLAVRRSHLALADHNRALVDAVMQATRTILKRERETVTRLAKAAESRDSDTGQHLQRMARYARLIAARLGMAKEQWHTIYLAAPMHDIGKVGIPDHILLKPGRHTPAESEVMRDHAQIGYEILKDSASPILNVAAEIALHHHEKYDGSGYPRGISGESIPIDGRIVAVADVFDALTSARPYKPAWELDRAADYLREQSGRHFDPRCVNAFLGSWDRVLGIRARYADPPDPAVPLRMAGASR